MHTDTTIKHGETSGVHRGKPCMLAGEHSRRQEKAPANSRPRGGSEASESSHRQRKKACKQSANLQSMTCMLVSEHSLRQRKTRSTRELSPKGLDIGHGGKDGVRSTEYGARSTESILARLRVFHQGGGSLEKAESVLQVLVNTRQSILHIYFRGM